LNVTFYTALKQTRSGQKIFSPTGEGYAAMLLKIGEVATQSGLPIKTIRYYTEIGLLTAERSELSGYRLFSPQIFWRLEFIKRAQTLGLSLKEIHQILDIHDQGQLPCAEVRQHLEDKIAAIDCQVAALLTLKQDLQEILSRWQEPSEFEIEAGAIATSPTICPNLQP
jgi:MerR family transcriptional regulator, copper efflux regulator